MTVPARSGDRPAPRPGGTRSPVLATSGMVAASQPLATAAGLRVLDAGGNAIDAAIAVAAVLAVVEPTMTGVGGDMFAVVLMNGRSRPVGLNGSGWAGSGARLDAVSGRELGPAETVTVPGAVRGWFALHQRYGTVPMSRLLAPAIRYADEGFPVSEVVAGQWSRASTALGADRSGLGPFLPEGKPPGHGDVFRVPALARTLGRLADEGPEAFYSGEVPDAIIESTRAGGGFLTEADFDEFDVEWVEPVSVDYRGYEVFELPPNTQGITVLEMLGIVGEWDLPALGHNSAEYVHALVEAKKLAFQDRSGFIADPRFELDPSSRLLSPEHFAELRRRIDSRRAAGQEAPGTSGGSGDTVCFSVVDRDRNAVSFINSLFESFGSGIVAGDTGVCLHNRGRGFSLDPRHPNRMAPRKRPFHTLIPAMVTREGRPWLAFGLMGGDMQAQGHLQVLVNMIDFGMNVQEAGDAPRFRHDPEGLSLEGAFGPDVRDAIESRGHRVREFPGGFGGYQGIMIDPDSSVLAGGSDHRKDGHAAGF